MSNKKRLGDYGEALATRFLEQKGYNIITTNWHCRYGEIDIVAQYADVWAFIEVKTRRSATSKNALEAITPQKQDKFIKAVQMYCSENDLDDITWRIDAIAVSVPHNQQPIIEHVEDAFDW